MAGIKRPEIRTIIETGSVTVAAGGTSTLFQKTLSLTEKLYVESLEITSTDNNVAIFLVRTFKGAEQNLLSSTAGFSPFIFRIPNVNVVQKHLIEGKEVNLPDFEAAGMPVVDVGQDLILRAQNPTGSAQTVTYKLRAISVVFK